MIDRFKGDNFFLSNMSPLENWIETDKGIAVPTSEHAYQAAKFTDIEPHRAVAEARANPDDIRPFAAGVASKELAYEIRNSGVPFREDWKTAKLGIMLVVVRQKFEKNPELAELLLATGDQDLVEGNHWGDTFWGKALVEGEDGFVGENHLGLTLMKVREELTRVSLR